MKNKRLLEMDALRALASLAVVLFHYTTRYDDLFGHVKQPYLNFSRGSLGVSIFFMMSGFVIFISLNKTENIMKYFKKRMIRLYPAYMVAVIVIYSLVKIYGLQGREVSLGDAIVNLSMLQGHIPWVSHVDGAFWTLTVELTFYIFMGISFYLGLTKNIVVFSYAWLAISSVIMIVSSQMNNTIMNFFKFLSISEFSHLFIAGMMFYFIKEFGDKKYYLVLASCLVYEFIFVENLISNIVVLFFFVLFYLLINNKLRFLSIPPLVFLGSISYSIYLLHQNIGYIIINILEKNGYVNEIYLIIPILVTIFLASILTFFIERPTQKWIKSRPDKSADPNGVEF